MKCFTEVYRFFHQLALIRGLTIFFILIISTNQICIATDTYAVPFESTEYLGNPTSDNIMEWYDPLDGGDANMKLIEVSCKIEPEEIATHFSENPDEETWQYLCICDERFEKYRSRYFNAIELSKKNNDPICKCIERTEGTISNAKYKIKDIKSGNREINDLNDAIIYLNATTNYDYLASPPLDGPPNNNINLVFKGKLVQKQDEHYICWDANTGKCFAFKNVIKNFTDLQVNKYISVVGEYVYNSEINLVNGETKTICVLSGCYVFKQFDL